MDRSQLRALQASVVVGAECHSSASSAFETMEIRAPRDLLPYAVRACVQCAWHSVTYVPHIRDLLCSLGGVQHALPVSQQLPASLAQLANTRPLPIPLMQQHALGLSQLMSMPPPPADPCQLLGLLDSGAPPHGTLAPPSRSSPTLPSHPQSPGAAGAIVYRLLLSQQEAKFLMAVPAERGAGTRPACRLQQLRNMAHQSCALQLHDNSDAKKVKLRCLEIQSVAAPPPAIAAAHTFLNKIVLMLSGLDPAACKLRLTLIVPKDGQAGAVIGRQGKFIEGLRLESKADIRVTREHPELSGGLPKGIAATDEFITVEGQPECVMSAITSMGLKLMEFQEKMLARSSSRREGGSASPVGGGPQKRHRLAEAEGQTSATEKHAIHGAHGPEYSSLSI